MHAKRFGRIRRQRRRAESGLGSALSFLIIRIRII